MKKLVFVTGKSKFEPHHKICDEADVEEVIDAMITDFANGDGIWATYCHKELRNKFESLLRADQKDFRRYFEEYKAKHGSVNMNCKIKETRVLSFENLRSLCIRRNWYTRGTCEDYENLFNRLRDENLNPIHVSTEVLYDLAQDIMAHSKIEDDYGITDVMYELATSCYVYFTDFTEV